MKCAEVRLAIEEMIITKMPAPPDIIEHIKLCPECREYYQKEQAFAGQIALNFASVQIPLPNTTAILEQTKRQIEPLNKWLVAASVAAIILLTISIFYVTNLRKDVIPVDQPGVNEAEYLSGRIDLPDGSYILTSSDSIVQVRKSEYQVILNKKGKLYVKANERHQQPLKVITPVGQVIVHGTEFSLSVDKDLELLKKTPYSVTVYVLGGTVELETPKGLVTGTGGETLYGVEGAMPVSYW